MKISKPLKMVITAGAMYGAIATGVGISSWDSKRDAKMRILEQENQLTEYMNPPAAKKIRHFADSVSNNKPIHVSKMLADTLDKLRTQAVIDSIKNVGVKEYLDGRRLVK